MRRRMGRRTLAPPRQMWHTVEWCGPASSDLRMRMIWIATIAAHRMRLVAAAASAAAAAAVELAVVAVVVVVVMGDGRNGAR